MEDPPPPPPQIKKPFPWGVIALSLIGAVVLYSIYTIFYREGLRPAPPSIDVALEEQLDGRTEEEENERVYQGEELTGMTDLREQSKSRPIPPAESSAFVYPVQDDEHEFTEEYAPIVIFWYLNYRHDGTRMIYDEIRQYALDNAGRVKVIFRHYPIRAIDWVAAAASECVTMQLGEEGFWDYTNLMFSGAWNPDKILGDAAAVGADADAVNTCIRRSNVESNVKVLEDIQSAEMASELSVSPAFVFFNQETGDVRISAGINTREYLDIVVNDL